MIWETIPRQIMKHTALLLFCYFVTITVHEGFHQYQFQRDYDIAGRDMCLLGASSVRDGDMSYGLGWFSPDFSTGQKVNMSVSELRDQYEAEAVPITIITLVVMMALYNLLFIWMPMHRATERLK